MQFHNKILQGNCLNILKEFPKNSVNHIITDPPYNISDKSKHTMVGDAIVPAEFGEWDVWTEEEYDQFVQELLQELYRICKRGANCLVWLDRAYTGIAWRFAKRIGWTPRNIIAAIKKNPSRRMRTKNLKSAWEACLWLSKGPVKTLNDCDGEEIHPNVIYYNIGVEKLSTHKTEKYESMIEPLVEWFTGEEDFVLDPFCGSGTTPALCKQKNRKYCGIEKSSKWVEFTERRLSVIGDLLF